MDKNNDRFKIMPMTEAVQEFTEGPVPSIPKEMTADIDDLPISRFECHLTDRTKARKKLIEMAMTVYDPEVRATMMDVPIHTSSRIKKNYMVAVCDLPHPETGAPMIIDVFSLNLKTGAMEHS